MDAKIALINFEQVVLASNEGQTVTANTQKKYEPKKNEIEKEATEVDALKKNLQAARRPFRTKIAPPACARSTPRKRS